MATWDELRARMDSDVDAVLGDSIELSLNSGATWKTVQGFVNPEVADAGIIGIDEPLGSRPRIKLAKLLFGGQLPGLNSRFRHARLGSGTFRPSSSEPRDQGNYWLIDVQKV